MVVDGHRLVVDDLQDGTYRVVLPPELQAPPDERRGVTTWTYDGQAVFHIEPGPRVDVPSDGDPSDENPDVIADLARTVRIDRYGRRWRAGNVDGAALAAKVAAYDAAHGIEPVGEPVVHAKEAPGTVTVHSWSTATCVATDYHLWEGEDRVKQFGCRSHIP